jgi:hypothetical protein
LPCRFNTCKASADYIDFFPSQSFITTGYLECGNSLECADLSALWSYYPCRVAETTYREREKKAPTAGSPARQPRWGGRVGALQIQGFFGSSALGASILKSFTSPPKCL